LDGCDLMLYSSDLVFFQNNHLRKGRVDKTTILFFREGYP